MSEFPKEIGFGLDYADAGRTTSGGQLVAAVDVVAEEVNGAEADPAEALR